MIKEFSQLTGIRFPFTSDNEVRRYLEQINTTWYNLKVLEKDFYLTGLLWWIGKELPDLSFKGGTCLNKIHFPYFRLSEDLDFSLPLWDTTPSQRKAIAHRMDERIQYLADIMGRSLTISHHELIKKKKYTYLKYELNYQSIIQWDDIIKIELSYTPKQYLNSVMGNIHHIYNNIVTEDPLFPNTKVQCLSIDEMIAEKVRASLTRTTPVIRDYYDLRFLSQQWYNFHDYNDLIRLKCSESHNKRTIEKFIYYHDWIEYNTFDHLTKKIDSDLLPVIIDKSWFNLKIIYDQLIAFKSQLI